MSASNPTRAELAALLAQAQEALARLAPQHATPVAVAEAVAPVAAPVVEKPVTASDLLKSHVESAGHAFAKGGRTLWTIKTLKAVTEVIRTGEPQLVPVTGKHAGRGVTHVAVGRGDEPGTAITQNVYTPTVGA